ncbi:MAG: hypothetical protein M1539_06765 [Actinobacteria bacterium]|nr:hypothetical protein [Actinomycetota bacterium]MCL5883656.1 hypothetical protein [Actinomycetota bacterium]
MDANYYCDAMYAELTSVKSRLYTIMRALGNMSDEEKRAASAEMTEMNRLADDLSAKLDQLKRECPTDWSPQKQEIDNTRQQLKEKIDYWDAQHIPVAYTGG